jgi:photosystem II stability/assembly factor-like uncharacterized protein
MRALVPSGLVQLLALAPCLLRAEPVASHTWRPLGPWGVKTSSFRLAPSEPSRIYLSGIGIWRSNDRAESWSSITEGLPPGSAWDAPLEVSPIDADLVLTARPEVHRTTNGGESWSLSNQGLQGVGPLTFHFLAFDPAVVLAGTAPGIFRSTDSGATWSAWSTEPTSVTSFASHPAHPGVVLAIRGREIHRSTDAGSTWLPVQDLSPRDARAQSIGGRLHWSLSALDRVFAFGSTSALFRSDDAGMSFIPLPRPNGGPEGGVFSDIRSVATHPTDPDIVMISAQRDALQGFCYITIHMAFRSNDAGDSWTTVFDVPCGTYPCFHQSGGIAIDAGQPEVVYVGTNHALGSGFWKTVDPEFDVWTPKFSGIGGQNVAFLRVDLQGNLCVRSSTGTGLWRASPPYESWTELPSIMPHLPPFRVVTSFDVNLTTPDLLFETGYTAECDYIDFWYDAFLEIGDSWWQDLTGGIPVLLDRFGTIATNHADGSTVYYWGHELASGDRCLYRSIGGLDSWEFRGSEFFADEAVISPDDPDRVFAVVNAPDRVRLTTDGGFSWEPRGGGLPAERITRILMDRSDPDHLIVSYRDARPWQTHDGGVTWNELEIDLQGALVWSIDWDAGEGRVFLATTLGVFDSERGFLGGFPTAGAAHVAFSESENLLFASPGDLSVYAIELDEDPVAVTDDPAGSVPDITAQPNPFAGRTVIEFGAPPDADAVVLEIFDVAGRRVRSWRRAPSAARLSIMWDGRDSRGVPVASGIYFARLDGAGPSRTLKIVRVEE